jgi:hypothetical protein
MSDANAAAAAAPSSPPTTSSKLVSSLRSSSKIVSPRLSGRNLISTDNLPSFSFSHVSITLTVRKLYVTWNVATVSYVVHSRKFYGHVAFQRYVVCVPTVIPFTAATAMAAIRSSTRLFTTYDYSTTVSSNYLLLTTSLVLCENWMASKSGSVHVHTPQRFSTSSSS